MEIEGSRVFNPVCVLRMIVDFSRDRLRGLIIGSGLRLLAKVFTYATLSSFVLVTLDSPSIAAGETRSISLYHTNTKESLTVTYKINGLYVPSAMKKLNYLLRDWRRNEIITIDPKVIDLIWDLHADLGSTAPINVVCGYRSAATNGFLRRVGRGVAKKSQHILGKAIDINFPDVPTRKIRNIALVRQFGGVGYYPTSGPRGFVHVDSGNVRQWGPAINAIEMAQIFSDGRRTIAARRSKNDSILMASAKPGPIIPAYHGVNVSDEEDLASLSEAASKIIAKKAAKPNEIPVQLSAQIIPKLKLKPKEMEVAAAADTIISPASAPPPSQVLKSKLTTINGSPKLAKTHGTIGISQLAASTKSSIGLTVPANRLRGKTAQATQLIKPVLASTVGSGSDGWPQLAQNSQANLGRDGKPMLIEFSEEPVVAEVDKLNENAWKQSEVQVSAEGKGDLLVVNREGKGDLFQ